MAVNLAVSSLFLERIFMETTICCNNCGEEIAYKEPGLSSFSYIKKSDGLYCCFCEQKLSDEVTKEAMELQADAS